jgi:hypothetical protein
MYIGLYRKPGFIAAAVLGLYFIVTVILDRVGIITYYTDVPYLEFFLGLVFLIGPTLVLLASLKQLKSNPSFDHEVTYTFGETGILVQGLTFRTELQWTHIIKWKEIDKFLLLYHSKKMGSFVDKTKLSSEQLQFIKSKVKAK